MNPADRPCPCETSPDTGQATSDSWRRRAACLDEEPELFFPLGSTGPALDQIVQAKAICGRCPVRKDCLDWALATNQDAGIWGGKTEDERRALRRSRQRRLRSRARPTS